MSERQTQLFDVVACTVMARLIEDERAGRAHRYELGGALVEIYGEWVFLVDGQEVPAHARHREPENSWELTLLGSSPLVDRFVWQPGEVAARIEWHTGQVTALAITPIADGYRIVLNGAEFELALRPISASLSMKSPPRGYQSFDRTSPPSPSPLVGEGARRADEGYCSTIAAPSSVAARHLLPQGEKEREESPDV